MRPEEALGAMLSEPDPTDSKHNRPEDEHQGPRRHDLKTSARIGSPMSRMAANNRSIPVPGGVS